MEFQIDKDVALFYGIMLGDGCLSLCSRKGRTDKSKIVAITGSSEDDLPFFQEVIAPILRKFRSKETKIKLRRNCNAIEYNFSDVKIFDFISSLGFPIGKKGDRLFIPKIFYELDLVDEVIAGFFATDGSVVLTKNPNKYYPRLEIHVISKSLLREVFDYLEKLGFKGSLYECKRVNVSPNSYNDVHKKYRIQFNGKNNLLLFKDLIGFANPKYQDKFNKFIDYSNNYDLVMKRVPCINRKPIYEEKNKYFMSNINGFGED